jgi:drug/metabolite transporter (DMT)-like permease
LIGFDGVLLIARPGGSSLPILGVVIGLIGAAGQAGITITLRHLQRSENVAAIVFWFAIAGVLAGGLLMPVFGQLHGAKAFALVLAGGLAGGIGQLLMTTSLRAPVSVVSPFDYLQIIAATAYGWILMSDVPSVYTIGGAGLIAGSGLYTAWREHRRRVQPSAAAVPAV